MSARAADHIREDLEQAILTGSYADGARLDELRLAEQFEVSRTPIREALQMLAAIGLVDLIPRRGAFVRHPGFVEMVEMFEVMAELECLCGRLAARRLTDVLLVELRAAESGCVAALESGDTDAYYRANESFHNLLYQASGNGFLTGEANRLHKRLQPFRRLQLRVRGRMVQSMDEHKAILSALEAGDAETAGRLLRDHVAIQGEKFHDLMAGFHGRSTAQSTGQSTGNSLGQPTAPNNRPVSRETVPAE